MATSLPPIRLAERPSEIPADLHVVVDLRDGPPSTAPNPEPNRRPHHQTPPIRTPVTPLPTPPPPPSRDDAPSAREFLLGETIPAGFQRMAVGLLDDAERAIGRPGGPGDDDVHTVRKSFRRVRGLLRLVRRDLGRAYRLENGVLRDTARLLSDVRSSAVAGMALSGLLDQFGSVLAGGVYDELSVELERRHRTVAARTLENRLLLAGVTTNLRGVRARVAAFPLAPSADFGYHGPLITNDSEVLADGLARTYRRGLEAMKRAAENPFPAQLHEWRKRVRYLRFQSEALRPAWPEVMTGLCKSLHKLAELLGHERDLWELAETVRTEPELCPGSAARELLSALTLETRQATRERAFRIGTRVYTEAPDVFSHRIQSYWDVWQTPDRPISR